MTWPREQGHISRTRGRRHFKLSNNLTEGWKCSYSKSQISSSKHVSYSAIKLHGGGIPPMCGRGLYILYILYIYISISYLSTWAWPDFIKLSKFSRGINFQLFILTGVGNSHCPLTVITNDQQGGRTPPFFPRRAQVGKHLSISG